MPQVTAIPLHHRPEHPNICSTARYCPASFPSPGRRSWQCCPPAGLKTRTRRTRTTPSTRRECSGARRSPGRPHREAGRAGHGRRP